MGERNLVAAGVEARWNASSQSPPLMWPRWCMGEKLKTEI